MKNFLKSVALLLLMIVVTKTSAQNQNWDNLIGEKATYIEKSMGDYGYTFKNTSKSGDATYQNYYNSRKNKCITVKISNGRIESIVDSTLADCNEGKYSNSSSNYGSNNSYESLVGEKATYIENSLGDLGYTYKNTTKSGDASYQNYYNSRKNKCITVKISNGRIESIVESTLADCNEGKYSNYSSGKFNTAKLINKDAVWAYGELQSNNFTQQKKVQDGGNTYVIWYNQDTGECYKTTSRSKKITSVIKSDSCK
jgi:hypothetical protein